MGKIEKIVQPFRGREGVKLLDYQRDEDHNRCVVTVVGEPDAVKTAVLEAMGAAVAVIDMRSHKGQHPRIGAVDVVPFIPVKNVTMKEAIELSRQVAAAAAEKFKVRIFLYEESATAPHPKKKKAAKKPAKQKAKARMKATKQAVKPAASAPTAAPAATSTPTAPRANTALKPAASWPFPTGSRPKAVVESSAVGPCAGKV